MKKVLLTTMVFLSSYANASFSATSFYFTASDTCYALGNDLAEVDAVKACEKAQLKPCKALENQRKVFILGGIDDVPAHLQERGYTTYCKSIGYAQPVTTPLASDSPKAAMGSENFMRDTECEMAASSLAEKLGPMTARKPFGLRAKCALKSTGSFGIELSLIGNPKKGTTRLKRQFLKWSCEYSRQDGQFIANDNSYMVSLECKGKKFKGSITVY